MHHPSQMVIKRDWKSQRDENKAKELALASITWKSFSKQQTPTKVWGLGVSWDLQVANQAANTMFYSMLSRINNPYLLSVKLSRCFSHLAELQAIHKTLLYIFNTSWYVSAVQGTGGVLVCLHTATASQGLGSCKLRCLLLTLRKITEKLSWEPTNKQLESDFH